MSTDNFPRSEWARRLRDQAEELQDRAVQAHSPEVRLNYLELARSWQQTAERVEERVEGREEDPEPKDPPPDAGPNLTQ